MIFSESRCPRKINIKFSEVFLTKWGELEKVFNLLNLAFRNNAKRLFWVVNGQLTMSFRCMILCSNTFKLPTLTRHLFFGFWDWRCDLDRHFQITTNRNLRIWSNARKIHLAHPPRKRFAVETQQAHNWPAKDFFSLQKKPKFRKESNAQKNRQVYKVRSSRYLAWASVTFILLNTLHCFISPSPSPHLPVSSATHYTKDSLVSVTLIEISSRFLYE